METKEIENKDYPNGVTLQTSSRKDLSERNQRHETHKSRGRPIEGQSVISYNF